MDDPLFGHTLAHLAARDGRTIKESPTAKYGSKSLVRNATGVSLTLSNTNRACYSSLRIALGWIGFVMATCAGSPLSKDADCLRRPIFAG